MPTLVRYIVLDVEATGPDPHQDRIIELYLAEVTKDFEIKTEHLFQFNPGFPLPARISKLTGISGQELQDKPAFAAHASQVQHMLADAHLISYNGRHFDWRFLHSELQRAGQPGFRPDQRVIDPLELFREDVSHTLAGAYRYYLGQDLPGAHRAKEDALATLAILKEQLSRRRKSLDDPLLGKEKRRRLDMSGHFYVDETGVTRIGFGKHRDEPATNDPDFLAWIMKSALPADTKQIAAKLLASLR